jgi:1,4-alpha-glucan branching enzyme
MRPSVAIAAAAGFVLLGVGLANVVRPNAGSVPQVAAGSVATPAAVRFVLVSEDAQRVSLVGDFNGWNAATLPLQRGPDGRSWTIEVRLPPGRYAYAFSVDGRLVADPSAPRSADEDFGVPTSVALVSEQRS